MINKFSMPIGLAIAFSIFVSGNCLYGQAGSDQFVEQESNPTTKAMDPIGAHEMLRSDQDLFFYLADPRFENAENVDGSKAMLGVHVRQADATLQHHLELKGDFGLVVEHVTAESAAQDAGLKLHDVLVKFDGQWLVNLDQLQSLIAMHQPGDSVSVQYYRSGELSDLEVKLSQQTNANLGAMSKELDKVHRNRFSHSQLKKGKLQDCRS